MKMYKLKAELKQFAYEYLKEAEFPIEVWRGLGLKPNALTECYRIKIGASSVSNITKKYNPEETDIYFTVNIQDLPREKFVILDHKEISKKLELIISEIISEE